MSDMQRISETFLKLLAGMNSAGLKMDSDEFRGFMEYLTSLLHELTDMLTHRLRTHASLDDIEATLQKIWEGICDVHDRDETKTWILFPRYSVDLLMHIVKTDSFHTMPEGHRQIARNKGQMLVVSALGGEIWKSPDEISEQTGFNPVEVRVVLILLAANHLITRTRSDGTIKYKLNKTGKDFLANVRTCAGKAHGFAAS